MEWQPIETAPKDGTIFDAWAMNNRYANCKYDNYRGEKEIWWNSHVPFSKHGEWIRLNKLVFTHWMPLPPPPTPKEIVYLWECNECGSQEYTMSVSETDVNELGCSSCGGDEWHKAIKK